jgi:hypothetical protein
LIEWIRETRAIDISTDNRYDTYSFLNHLKVVYQPDLPLEVKAYAGFFNIQNDE